MALPLIATAMGLAQFAPIISRWLGGKKAEEVAQKIVGVAQDITQCMDPAAAFQKLQENNRFILEFQRSMLDLDLKLEQMELADRQDARARDVAIIRAGNTNIRADIMVISAALGLVMCLGSLGYYSHKLPGEAVGIISTIAGIFGACLKDAYAFEFGSSRGSKEKDVTVAALLDQK